MTSPAVAPKKKKGIFTGLMNKLAGRRVIGSVGQTVKKCEWSLSARVKSQEPTIWPKSEVRITATLASGTGPAMLNVSSTPTSPAGQAVVVGTGQAAATYSLTAATDEEGWTLVASQPSGALSASVDALVELELSCPLMVYMRLTYLDPEGTEIPFPPDFPVRVQYDDDDVQDELVTDDGKLTFEVPRTKQWFTLWFVRGAKPFVASAPPGWGGGDPQRMAEMSDIPQLQADEFRFFSMPEDDFNLINAAWTVTGSAEYDGSWRFDLGAGNDQVRRIGSDGARVTLELDPHWQFLRIEYFDRYYGHRSVHANRRVNIPPVIVDGYRDAPAAADDPEPEVRSYWPLDEDDIDAARLCVPWVVQWAADGSVEEMPDEQSGFGFSLESDLYVFSASATDRTIEQITMPSDRLAPSVDRLRLYDLPEEWRSTNYYVRFADDTGMFFKPASAGLRDRILASRARSEPLIFCLDDMVLVDEHGAVLKQPAGARVCVFHHQFKEAGDGATKPLSKCGLHDPGATVDEKGYPYSKVTVENEWYIADYPNWTRLVVAGGDLFDVFMQRSTATNDDEVLGARVAIRWDASAARAAAGATLSPRPGLIAKDYFSIQPFYEQSFLSRNYPGTGKGFLYEWGSPRPTAGTSVGRFDIALLRCCGYDGKNEIAVVFRYHRFAFDFATRDSILKGASAASQKGWIKRLADNVANRWNGDDDKNADRTWIQPRGATPKLKLHATVITFVQHLDKAKAHFEIAPIQESEISSMNASMGTGKLRPSAVIEVAGTGGKTGLAAAHETGHTHGLPDEYSPSVDGQNDFGSNHMLGGPYILDLQAMMRGNRFVRAHELWYVAEWLRTTNGLDTTEFKVVHGAEDYELPHYTHAKPGRHWAHWPVRAYLRHKGAGGGCFDAHLYLLGKDLYSTSVLPAYAGGGTFDGILTIFVRTYFEFPDSLNDKTIRKNLYADVNAKVSQALNKKRVAQFTVASPGPPPFTRCLVQFAERYLANTLSTASDDDKKKVTDVLARAPYHLKVIITERTAAQQTEIDKPRQRLLDRVAKRYDAMPQPLTQALTTQRQADEQAANTQADALKLPPPPGATQANEGDPWELTIDLPKDYSTLADSKKSKERERFAQAVLFAVVRALGLRPQESGKSLSYHDAHQYQDIVKSVMVSGVPTVT